MDPASLARLVLLSSIWGASFLFIRIGAPVLGPSLLIFARVGLAAVFLLAVALYLKRILDARQHWRHYLMLGLFNSALPFLLFAYAAQTVSASLLSILNATAPTWAAALGAAWTRTRLAPRPLIGLLLGIAGVALLAGVETLSLPAGGGLAIVAALGAALCYGVSSVYARSARATEPFANAHGSMWAATLLLIPAALLAPWPETLPDGRILLAVVALGVLCSGIAYLLYFRLVVDLGASSALTVTFLIPVFGILWGVLFLDEAVGWHTFAGSVLVLAGTALATGFSIRSLFARTETGRA
ncbi:MAG: DMT family transporter [Betaproteobacteria bacterium]|nr:DMT family transporter [Betaproteobacteria bacterium]